MINFIRSRSGIYHKITREHLQKFIEKYATKVYTLDLGCGSGAYSKFFPNRIGVDKIKGPLVDIIADAHDLHMFENESFGCVLFTEVLEHLHSPQIAIREIFRILKKNGLLILTTRFIYPLHEIPHDYYRFTRYGLKFLLKDFEIIEIKEETKSLETLAVLFQRIGFQTKTLNLKYGHIFWLSLARFIKFLSKTLKMEYGNASKTKLTRNIFTTGYYVACKKPNKVI